MSKGGEIRSFSLPLSCKAIFENVYSKVIELYTSTYFGKNRFLFYL